MPELQILCGDSADILRQLPDHCVDALITDPPSGIAFMSSTWDSDRGGRDQWVGWLAGILRECRRVLKPSHYGWIWALPRTAHWTATACEDAGFQVRDVYRAAMPAESVLEPLLERLDEEERLALARVLDAVCPGDVQHQFNTGFPKSKALLKPALECWILVRAPGPELLDLRIDENRIAISEEDREIVDARSGADDGVRDGKYGNGVGKRDVGTLFKSHANGRWPAHFGIMHSESCEIVGTKTVKNKSGSVSKDVPSTPSTNVYGDRGRVAWQAHGDADGNEVVEAWQCAEGCPVGQLDAQAGVRTSGKMPAGTRRKNALGYSGAMPDTTKKDCIGDSGAASRFFYTRKPSTRERDAGCEHLRWAMTDPPQLITEQQYLELQAWEAICSAFKGRRLRFVGEGNVHPTVKPVALMQHLLRLIAKPGDLILDPFAGSSTTGVAAAFEDCHFLGIDQDEGHCAIGRARMTWASAKPADMSVEKWLKKKEKPAPMPSPEQLAAGIVAVVREMVLEVYPEYAELMNKEE